MAAPLLTCTKVEQRSVIRFLFSEGVKPIEIHRRMKVQYGDACLSLQQVYAWSRKFQNGVTSVRDGSRPGQAHRVVTPVSIAAVEYLIQENRRLTVCDIAAHLDISQGSAHNIIHNVLHYRKVSDWWVPRQLTPELKQIGIDACQELLQCFEAEGKKQSEAQPKKDGDAEKQEKAPAAKGEEKGGKTGGKE